MREHPNVIQKREVRVRRGVRSSLQPRAASEPLLTADGVAKSFSGVPTRRDGRLERKRGTLHALCGGNGAGKSTFLNILMGLLQRDEGVVRLGAEVVEFNGPADALHHGRVEITDCVEAAGAVRRNIRASSGAQPGDPARAAEAIIKAVEAPDPPLHLLLGNDAVVFARARLDLLRRDFDSWESVLLGADFPERLVIFGAPEGVLSITLS